MSSEVAALEAEVREYKLQVSTSPSLCTDGNAR